MILDFDRGTKPGAPVSVPDAIRRGQALVNRPVLLIMIGVAAIGIVVAQVLHAEVIGLVILLSAPVVAWPWWSYSAPRWRHWALKRGADPDELQRVAEQQKLLWPRGHFFEKTEFPYRGE